MATGKYRQWLEPEGLLLLEAWARDGLADEQIANNCGISRSALSAWKKAHPQILQALKRGKEVADIEVENALYKRALGYRYKEVTQEVNKQTQCLETTKEITKEVAPDVKAQIFWLKNRKPGTWRDKTGAGDSLHDRTVVIGGEDKLED